MSDQWDFLYDAARKLNRWTGRRSNGITPARIQVSTPGNRPGDDFNRRVAWEDVLCVHGWKPVREYGGKVYWQRPGKDDKPGTSATTGHCKSDLRGDLLYVFSTNAHPLEKDHAYSKFEAYAVLEHAGDMSAAARALSEKGFGEQTETFTFKRVSAGDLGKETPEAPTPEPAPPETEPETQVPLFGPPVPASQLKRVNETAAWLWRGYLSLGGITILSALWKAGKTTLLAHLAKAFESNGMFCNQPIRACKVLCVTEEHENLWAERRDKVGLNDHIEFLIRPFAMKPSMTEWVAFLNYLQTVCIERDYDLIIFDTLSDLWPVREENDAGKMQEAMKPLRAVSNTVSFLLVHHLRKSDGGEATGSRGSGALTAFVDTILELRRYNASDRKDRRRVLSGYGRHSETPEEVVIELCDHGYTSHGDKSDVSFRNTRSMIEEMLPVTPPGVTAEQLLERWPEDNRPNRNRFFGILKDGVEEGRWHRSGEGVRGNPYLFWRPRNGSVSSQSPRDRDDTEESEAQNCPFDSQ